MHLLGGGAWSCERRIFQQPIVDIVLYGFGERSHHPPYDRGGARLQGIYRTVYSKWSSPIDQAYEGTTIPVLHAWWWCPCYTIRVVVHNTKLEPTGGSSCVTRWCGWKDDATGQGAWALQANTHEEFRGYCKRHIMLYTILGKFEDSRCWRIMLASLRELDIVLDTCSCCLGRPSPRYPSYFEAWILSTNTCRWTIFEC